MRDLITTMVQALVDDPDQVSVNELEGRHATIFEVKVAKRDIGKVIGKKGATVGALRTILSAAGGKLNRRMVLEILD